MRFKLIDSKVSDKSALWHDIRGLLGRFNEKDYKKLAPLIYERSIEQLQQSRARNEFTYEQLAKWYLYRMIKYEGNPITTLNTLIAVNNEVIKQAIHLDQAYLAGVHHPIYGMPILLKDNINTEGMNTTAGAIALKNNRVSDAHIVSRLKENGALILGKVNLSEWAYYFCAGCPLGYSAVGGQTLNPYGRGIFETGGSSSGSGTAVAANYAVAAVGTETSGSILSPSSKNALVGLKPTVGMLSRTGIVPISSTLDTPGPMTKGLRDNMILLSAMMGYDDRDKAMRDNNNAFDPISIMAVDKERALSLVIIESFLKDSLYVDFVNRLLQQGITIDTLRTEVRSLLDFDLFLSAEMKRDLETYLRQYGDQSLDIKSVVDVVDFNNQDSFLRAPYGQARLISSANNELSDEELHALRLKLQKTGESYFQFYEHRADAVLSMNNASAGFAAVARYPCLTIPLGFKEDGEPINLTIISESHKEPRLYAIAMALESLLPPRKPPSGYGRY